MLKREGIWMEIRRSVVVLLYGTLFLSLMPGCGEVADPRPVDQIHQLKREFRNADPAFVPPSFWDRFMYVPSRTWVTTVHPRQANLPRVENDGSILKHNRTDPTVTWVGHSTVLVSSTA